MDIPRTDITADDLDDAATAVVAVLRTAPDTDWRAAGGTGGYDAWFTAEHVGDTLISYAAQLCARPDGRYVPFVAKLHDDADLSGLLEFVVAGAGILSAAVRTAPPQRRAYHPSGMADPPGFAGMGCVELLVHGEDVARGLGLALDPPRAVCERVVRRMFPTAEVSGLDPWTALLWATNRVQLPGRPAQEGWRWRGAPLTGRDPVSGG